MQALGTLRANSRKWFDQNENGEIKDSIHKSNKETSLVHNISLLLHQEADKIRCWPLRNTIMAIVFIVDFVFTLIEALATFVISLPMLLVDSFIKKQGIKKAFMFNVNTLKTQSMEAVKSLGLCIGFIGCCAKD